MDPLVRRLASWLVTVSLLAGMALPFSAGSPVVDPDGACGPVVIADHLTQSFESPLSLDRPDHCVLCHWWNAMASASTLHIVQVAPPSTATASLRPLAPLRAELVADGHAAPRAPPSLG